MLLDILDALASLGVAVSGVADDSRQVLPGDVFLAYPGDLADGRQYIAKAIEQGAVAVLWQPGGGFVWNPEWAVPHLSIAALRPLAGPLAHAIYGRPSEALSMIAITGTNGKTTVSQCLARAYPKSCAVIGTLGAGFPGALQDTGFTTPEATTLMRYLAGFRRQGASACVIEASSIGIEEGRMNGLMLDVAVFTNITRDHLDYHGSMEYYAEAKARLFCWPGLRTAIINLDDQLGQELIHKTTARRILAYAITDKPGDSRAQVRAEQLVDSYNGQAFTLVLPNGEAFVETGLVGRYNIHNLLAVAAVLYDFGLTVEDIALRLASLTPPPGRMERLGGNGEPMVVVDYAHTPDALDNALRALRSLATTRGGQLRVVFGCGGDRDRGKRPIMGELAERLADQVLVTSDNPRSEEPLAIIQEIVAGMTHPEVEPDRISAVARVIREAGKNDVILLAGKGHEPYQEIAGVRHPYSDIEQAQTALLQRRAIEEAA